MKEIISYILRFLIGEYFDENVLKSIAYTSDKKIFPRYKLVIYPSSFFSSDVYGTACSVPSVPLKEIDGVPLLFGEPKIEKRDGMIILYADIIASAYFLISRYEEFVRRDVRDAHGRFPGKESLPYKAGFIDRPLVEEYGGLLRKLLRELGLQVSEPAPEMQKIYLTHDVDAIAHYRRLRGVAGALLHCSQPGVALKSYFGSIMHDPWFTFPWLLQQNALLGNDAESIFFIKASGGRSSEDQPHSDIKGKDFQYLFRLLKDKGVSLGLHASYEAGKNPFLIQREKELLEETLNQPIYYNRNHYLDSREPEDMQVLTATGITDDFTLGYADVAGFRIGTCRPVRWINPLTRQLTALKLHPLTVMDGTLNGEKYMNLPETEAYDYTVRLINRTERHGGDLCLLWHNTSVEKAYHRNLYQKTINYLKKNK